MIERGICVIFKSGLMKNNPKKKRHIKAPFLNAGNNVNKTDFPFSFLGISSQNNFAFGIYVKITGAPVINTV